MLLSIFEEENPQNLMHIFIKWFVYFLVYLIKKNSVCIKQIVLQNMISESGPLDQPFEEKTTCVSVGDVPVHTAVRLQTVDAEKIFSFC